MALQREGVVDAVTGAKRPIGRSVGVDGAAYQAHRAETVVAAQRVGGHRRQEYLLAAIGAAIHQHDGFASDDLAVFGHCRAYAYVGIFPAQAGQHLVPPRVHQPHGTAGRARQQSGERFERPIEFEAEPAADRGDRDADIGRRHVQEPGGRVFDRPGDLRGCFDVESPVLVGSNDGARLQSKVILPPDTKRALDDLDIGARESQIDVAAHYGRFPRHVAAPRGAFQQNLVVAPLRMDQRGVRRQSVRHRDCGRQRLELDHQSGGGGLRLRQRLRGDRRDRLAVVSDAIGGEQRMIGNADAVADRRVGRRCHRADAGHRQRRRHIDTHNSRRRHLGAGQRRVQHARTDLIDGVTGAAAQLVARVAPREVHGCAGRRRHVSSPRLAGR
jgi:hypothetical protein